MNKFDRLNMTIVHYIRWCEIAKAKGDRHQLRYYRTRLSQARAELRKWEMAHLPDCQYFEQLWLRGLDVEEPPSLK